MLCIKSPSLNPYFNIAAEEHLLRGFTEGIFYVYRNSPSIIVGKHQNAIAEINYVYAQNNGVDMESCISGEGGGHHVWETLTFTLFAMMRGGKSI